MDLNDWADVAQYVSVAFIGASIGMGELVSRYKDDPYEALRNRHAITYVLINAIASLVALLTLKTLGNSSSAGQAAAQRIGHTLAAGFGAMAILRSSAFTVRVGKDDVSVGPSALLHILLSATDRAVDRARARVRAEQMARTMKAMSFDTIAQALPHLAFTMMQNVTKDERDGLSEEIERLRKQEIDPVAKSICLGLTLSNIVGQGVVDAAVSALRETLREGGDPALLARKVEALSPPAAPRPPEAPGATPTK